MLLFCFLIDVLKLMLNLWCEGYVVYSENLLFFGWLAIVVSQGTNQILLCSRSTWTQRQDESRVSCVYTDLSEGLTRLYRCTYRRQIKS